MVMSARFTISIVLAVCILSACGTTGLAQSVTLNPVADAFVASSEPTSNYGGGGAFGVSVPTTLNNELQTLLRFDLSTAKTSFDTTLGAGNWSLSSALLQLSATSANSSIFNTPS